MKVFNSFQEVMAVSNYYGQDTPSTNPSIVPKVGVSIHDHVLTPKLQGGIRERETWVKLKQSAETITGHITGLGNNGEEKKAHNMFLNTGTGMLTIEGMPPVLLSVNPIDAVIAAIDGGGRPDLMKTAEKPIWDYVNANLDKIEWEI